MADAVGGAGGDVGSECVWDMATVEDTGGKVFDRVRGKVEN